jgi:hypothetical protein
VEEFLRLYPTEWIVFDWFVYGNLQSNDLPVQPAWFVKDPFREIIGRDMPDEGAKIASEESLEYKPGPRCAAEDMGHAQPWGRGLFSHFRPPVSSQRYT